MDARSVESNNTRSMFSRKKLKYIYMFSEKQ